MSIITVPKHFVGLHNHTGASVFDGLADAQEHINFVLQNGMDAFAITEHGHCNSYANAYLYSEKLKKQNKKFKFIAGAELYLHPNLDEWRLEKIKRDQDKNADAVDEEIVTPLIVTTDGDDETVDIETSNALTIEREDESKSTRKFDPINRRHHIVVIPKTSIGLQRLFHLVSRGYSEGFYRFPRIDYQMLKEAAHGDHLIVLTACLGGTMSYASLTQAQNVKFESLTHSLLDDQSLMNKVQIELGNTHQKLVDAVGEQNVFLELQFNKLPAQNYVNRALLTYARNSNLTKQLVCAADSHYPNPDLWKEREIYKKLGWLKYTEIDASSVPTDVSQLKATLYPKNATQVWDEYNAIKQDFYDDEEVRDAIERSYHIAHDLIGNVEPDRSMKLPTSIVVPKGMTADERLLELCQIAMKERNFHDNQVYQNRLKEELNVICEKKFAEYFLTLREIIDVAQQEMLVAPGRGSGAGCLVNYLLKITDVDPIAYELLFERFLNRFREEAPDVDTDVSNRALLIKLLRDKFGAENVVPISNYNSFKLKSLVKDVGKFYGVPFEETNNATKTVESEVRKATLKHGDDKNLFVLKFDDAMKYSPSFRAFMDKYPNVAAPITTLFKQPRSLGRHAGGVIVCDNIAKRMPLIASKGEQQTPWSEGVNVKELDQFGWIKFDLLGLDTLAMIENAIFLILQKERLKRGWFSITTDSGQEYAYGDQICVTNNRGKILVKNIVCGDDVVSIVK